MKPIEAAGLARRYAAAQRVAWLLDLADGSWVWRGATLAVNYDDNDYPARLGRVERWREWLPEIGREGGRARAEAELFIPDTPDAAASLRAELEARAPVGIAATLRLAWLDVAGAEDPAAATMVRGRLTAWRIAPAGVALTLTDELETVGQRRIGRLLRPAMLPGAVSPAMGRPLPWIFGALDDAELVPLDIGAASPLAEDIAPQDAMIPLESLAGFPASGVVQLGEERIRYFALDAQAMTLGRPDLPAIRDVAATAHRAGETVRRVPPGGFLWLAADHPCRAIGPVRADGVSLDPSAWQPLTLGLGGEKVQAIRVASWPLDEDGKPVRRLSASVEGYGIASAPPIDNPARVIEVLLIHGRLGALAPDRLDAVNLMEIENSLDLRGYRYARRLAGDETLGELLDGAAEEAALWIQATDPIRLVAADPVPHVAAAAEDLDDTRLLQPAHPARLQSPADFIPPDAVELVGAPRGPGQPRPALLFPPERESAGVIPRRYAIVWLDLRQADAAADLGELLWRRLGEAPFSRPLDCPLGVALLSAGETLRLTDPPLGMTESLAWVRAIETGAALGSDARARLEVWGPWAGDYCWKPDLSNFIRRFAFGGHLLFVLGGAPVALLTRAGSLRLAGRLRERAVFNAGPFADPIALDGGWLYCGVGEAGSFAPFLRIDASGNAELTGTLRERTALPIDPGGACHGATAERFWFSPDAQTGALEWSAAAAMLHLPGILIEGVRL